MFCHIHHISSSFHELLEYAFSDFPSGKKIYYKNHTWSSLHLHVLPKYGLSDDDCQKVVCYINHNRLSFPSVHDLFLYNMYLKILFISQSSIAKLTPIDILVLVIHCNVQVIWKQIDKVDEKDYTIEWGSKWLTVALLQDLVFHFSRISAILSFS